MKCGVKKFTEMYETVYHDLYRYALCLMKNPQEAEELGEFIREITDKFNLTIFMIEHHMNLVMGISDRIYVIDFGKQIAEGTPREVQDNPAVIAAYLGEDEA